MEATFTQKVLSVVSKIPKGSVLTYAQVARKAGSSKAVRAVGTIMSKNYDLSIPCHRVIRSDGKIGNYNRGGSTQKIKLLHQEDAF
jgi:methylated-DNA-[protein]-cysteine S-methyltransferase